MPSSTSSLTQPGYIRRFYTNGDTETLGPTPSVAQVIEVSTPLKVRRPRPSDLFANSTAWECRTKIVNYSKCRKTVNQGAYFEHHEFQSYSFGGPVPVDVPGKPDFGQVDQKLRLKIKAQKVDLPVMITEMGQTMSMITGLATDITEAFKTLRRGHPLNAVRRLLSDPRTRADRAIANRWLEYSFGVVPTMSDIYGLAESLAVTVNRGIYTYAATTSVSKSSVTASPGLWAVEGDLTTYLRVRARFKYVSNQLLELSRLGITNPASFLWEKTAWSFAVDWILNIGDFVAGLDALIGVEELLVYRSWGHDAAFRADYPGIEPLEGGTCAIGEYFSRNRAALSSDLSFGVPELRSPLDTGSLGTRFANASALLRQIVR